MSIYKKLGFCLVFSAFLAVLPFSASAEGSRFFVKSTNGFWKNALGVRHSFENGFSSDLSDFQIRFAKMFGVEIEPIAILEILPSNTGGINNAPIDSSVKPTAKARKPIRLMPSDNTPWGVEVVYGNEKIASTSGGEGISVAVLDTGVNINHPDLVKRIAQCVDFTNTRMPIVDGKCEDNNGHGTHVAGIVAADGGVDGLGIYGIAPQAKVFAYKVCNTNGSCYADDVAVAIRVAADRGANIINMSFGTESDNSLIRDAINYASSKGLLSVAAAGNDGPFQGSIDYPAAYSSVIAAGAIDKNFKVPEWSSRGLNLKTDPEVINDGDLEFAAPGEYIESTWNNNGYVILSGTSMASPFVAGLAAKYWQSSAVKPTAEATRIYLHSLAVLLPGYTLDSEAAGSGLPIVK